MSLELGSPVHAGFQLSSLATRLYTRRKERTLAAASCSSPLKQQPLQNPQSGPKQNLSSSAIGETGEREMVLAVSSTSFRGEFEFCRRHHLGPLCSSSSQHRLTLDCFLYKGHESFRSFRFFELPTKVDTGNCSVDPLISGSDFACPDEPFCFRTGKIRQDKHLTVTCLSPSS